jgi:hypothetical protein
MTLMLVAVVAAIGLTPARALAVPQPVTSVSVSAPGQMLGPTQSLGFDTQRGLAVRSSTGRRLRLLIGISGCCGRTATHVTATIQDGQGAADEELTFPFDHAVHAHHATAAPARARTYLSVRAKSGFGSVHVSFVPRTGNLAPKLVNGYPPCYQSYLGTLEGSVSFNTRSRYWGRISLGRRVVIGHSVLTVYLVCGFNGFPPTFCARAAKLSVYHGLQGPSLTATTPWIGPTYGDLSDSSGPAQLLFRDVLKLHVGGASEPVQRTAELRRLPAADVAFDYASGPAFTIALGAAASRFASGTLRAVVAPPLGSPGRYSCRDRGRFGTTSYAAYTLTSLSPVTSPLRFSFTVGGPVEVEGKAWQPGPRTYQDQVTDNNFTFGP